METIQLADLLSWSQCWIYLIDVMWYSEDDIWAYGETTRDLLKEIWESENAWKYFNT
jgi:hypothetical protein